MISLHAATGICDHTANTHLLSRQVKWWWHKIKRNETKISARERKNIYSKRTLAKQRASKYGAHPCTLTRPWWAGEHVWWTLIHSLCWTVHWYFSRKCSYVGRTGIHQICMLWWNVRGRGDRRVDGKFKHISNYSNLNQPTTVSDQCTLTHTITRLTHTLTRHPEARYSSLVSGGCAWVWVRVLWRCLNFSQVNIPAISKIMHGKHIFTNFAKRE